MKDPLISVVIPAYNAAATLPRALDSVFAQTHRNYEVVVVDDGSTDSPEEVVKTYGEKIRFVRQGNAGAAAARNHGARLARGRYMAFLDADDFWHPEKLRLQLRAFHRFPDIALCTTFGRRLELNEFDLAKGVLASDDCPITLISDFRKIFSSPYLGTPGVMMPREVFFRHGGFRENLKSAEDVDLWLRAAYKAKVARIPRTLFFMVSSPNSLTALHQDGTYEDNLQVIEDFCEANPEFAHGNKGCVRRTRAKVYEDWGSAALVRGELSLAKQVLRCSLGEHISLRALYLFFKASLLR